MKVLVAIVGTLLLGLPGAASGAGGWSVENWGTDSPTCGGKKTPCRTLSQAMANATAGDLIRVGPGHYGNLDGDHGFTDPGEEFAAQVDTGCNCMILVDKPLSIVSTHGAEMTVLNAGGDTGSSIGPTDVVGITADGARLGAPGRGFTLTRGAMGVYVDASAQGAVIEGNIALHNQYRGFFAHGDNGHRFSLNSAVANGSGFYVQGQSGQTGGSVFENNLALVNQGTGFSSSGVGVRYTGNLAATNGGHGFQFFASETVAVANSAVANALSGFNLQGASLLIQNAYVIGNEGPGISVGDPNDNFSRSVGGSIRNALVLGNQEEGVLLRSKVTSAPAVHDSAIYENDHEAVIPVFGAPPECELENRTNLPVDATGNYWGDASGPGGGVCSVGTAPTSVPFETAPPKVKMKRKSPL